VAGNVLTSLIIARGKLQPPTGGLGRDGDGDSGTWIKSRPHATLPDTKFAVVCFQIVVSLRPYIGVCLLCHLLCGLCFLL